MTDEWTVNHDGIAIATGELPELLEEYGFDEDIEYISPHGVYVRPRDIVSMMRERNESLRTPSHGERWEAGQKSRERQMTEHACDDCGSIVPEGECRCKTCGYVHASTSLVETIEIPDGTEPEIDKETVMRARLRGHLRGISKQNHDIINEVRKELGQEVVDDIMPMMTQVTRKNLKWVHEYARDFTCKND